MALRFFMDNGFSMLSFVSIPSTITSIGDSCFWGCSSLTSIMLTPV